MKKIFIIILILMFIPIIKAESINKSIEISGKYQNFNGVNIDKENYNKIKNILTESEIENLTQEDYQEIEKSEKILDATIYVSEKKYVIVSGTRLLIEENDLSIAEYNEITDNNSNLVKTNSIDENVSYETTLYGTYQHAQGDVTLAQSKLFTIGSGGMGNVIYWGTNELNSIYNNTAGVNLTFTC